jgi:hypothetical protein
MKRLVLAIILLTAAACSGTSHGTLPLTTSYLQYRAAVQVRDVAAASPSVTFFWMILESSTTAPVLEKIVRPQDYISAEIARDQPDLLARVGGWTHVFGSGNSSLTGNPPPLGSVQSAIARCPTGQIQFYDGEHWGLTPESDQHDPAGAILRSAAEIKSTAPCAKSNFSAYSAGITPDGPFEGWYSCSYDPASPEAFYNEQANEVTPIGGTAWTNTGSSSSWLVLKYYNTQGQTLLSETPWDRCYGSVQFWLSSMTSAMQRAVTGNPQIVLITETSFGDENWEQQVNAISAMEAQKASGGLGAEYYAIYYPDPNRARCPSPDITPTPSPHSWTTRCTFSQPWELEQFGTYMEGLPTPSPTPPTTPIP